jgi:hypothetical protein
MKKTSAILLIAAASAVHASPSKSKPSPIDWNPAAPSPRSKAIEIAGAPPESGYIARDGFWLGTLEKQKPVVLAVNLFAGNEYRFSAANLDPATQLRVSVFDGEGRPTGSENPLESSGATASVAPLRNGRHFVRLLMTEGDKAETCMVYFYK